MVGVSIPDVTPVHPHHCSAYSHLSSEGLILGHKLGGQNATSLSNIKQPDPLWKTDLDACSHRVCLFECKT